MNNNNGNTLTAYALIITLQIIAIVLVTNLINFKLGAGTTGATQERLEQHQRVITPEEAEEATMGLLRAVEEELKEVSK